MDKRRNCRFKGCTSHDTVASVQLTTRKAGREGRRSGGLVGFVGPAVLCQRHLDVVVRRFESQLAYSRKENTMPK